jgi:hypothetical protein
MSNLNSSTVTPSLNSPPPAPQSTPSSSFGSNITDSFNKLTSTVTEAASDLTERASDTANSLTNQASDAVSSGINTLSTDVSSLTGTEPEQPVVENVEEEQVKTTEEVNQPEVASAETLANIPSSQETFGPSKVTRKRCRNGTRKDKNGDCQPKQAKQSKHRKGAVKSHHMTAKYQELKLENTILIRQQKKAINLTKKLMNFLTLQ